MKYYELMNYFLPVQVGAPDYFFYLINQMTHLNLSESAKPGRVENISDFSFWRASCLKNVNVQDKLLGFLYQTAKQRGEINANNSLGPYLAGLLEGVGHIILSNLMNSKEKISDPSIAITFGKKDLPLISKLVEKYGGRIKFKNKANAIVWIINNHESLIKFIHLINGYLRTPKINQFNTLISWLNQKYSYNIPVFSTDMSDLNKNGWLAGFIDACRNGGFKIIYNEKRIDNTTTRSVDKIFIKGRIEVRFVLEQEQQLSDCTENSFYKPIMVKIQSFFNINTDLRISKHNIDKNYWFIEVTSLNKLNLLIQYLKIFPLLTAKRNDFDDWLKVYQLILDNRHLSEEGKLLIKEIKSANNKNQKRYNLNWDHLNFLNKVQ